MHLVKSGKKLVSLTSIYTIGTIGETSVNFFLLPIITLFLEPEAFGIISLLSLTVRLITQFISIPARTAMERFFYTDEYKDKSRMLVFNLFVFMLIQLIIAGILFFMLRNVIAVKLFDNFQYANIVAWYTVILILQPTSGYMLALLRIKQKARYYVIVSLTALIIKFISIITLLKVFDLGVMALVYSHIFYIIFLVASICPELKRSMRLKLKFTLIKEPLKYGYPLIPTSFTSLIIENGDRYVIKAFSSVNVVGLYSFGYQIASAIGILLVIPLKQALFPVILEQEKSIDKVKIFLRKSATYYYVLGMFITLGFSIFSYEIIRIVTFSDSYVNSHIIIPIIAVAIIFQGLGNFFSWGLIIKKKTINISIILIVVAISNIVLNIILFPILGILGAAIATLIAYIIGNAMRTYYTNKFLNLKFEIDRIVLVTFVWIVLFSLTFIPGFPENMFTAILLKCLICALYPAILFFIGFLNPNEKKLVFHSFAEIKKNGLKSFILKLISQG